MSEIILLGGVSPYGTALLISASYIHGSSLGLSASLKEVLSWGEYLSTSKPDFHAKGKIDKWVIVLSCFGGTSCLGGGTS